MTRPPRIRSIAVVVPVRDEESLLRRCLSGIAAAVDRVSALPQVEVAVTIVLDSCTDGSAGIAAGFDVGVVTARLGRVGLARALGVDATLARLSEMSPASTWIANTDADSAVPPDWLTEQLALADRGWDAVLGCVLPDVAELAPELHEHALRATAAGREAPVHGANLGVRASAYLSAGGFAPLPEHEDVRLVEALRATGARVVSTRTIPVLTSARTVGRTPGGYAGYLRRNLLSEA